MRFALGSLAAATAMFLAAAAGAVDAWALPVSAVAMLFAAVAAAVAMEARDLDSVEALVVHGPHPSDVPGDGSLPEAA